MSKKHASVIITDLDNTLFDWAHQWYHSFNAMLLELEKESGISLEKLIPEIKTIHQRHRTSEYAFLVEEIPALQKRFPGEDFLKRFDNAIHAYRSARKKHLSLYPTVRETLETLRKTGCLVVGYTESMAYYSNYRVRKLNLDGLLDFLFSPPDHDFPVGLTPEQIRMYPNSHYTLKSTKHEHTPEGELKPNPKLLLDIIRDVGANPDQCIYVGDSLFKDVQMAQAANVTDVHAEYGTAHTREEYKLLVAVTHWTEEDVQRERDLKKHDVNPSFILKNTFSEILELFEPAPFR